MARMGRPKKEIDKKRFEALCMAQCTISDICDDFDIDAKTLSKWCKETYGGLTFSQVFKLKRKKGFNSLRAKQYELAIHGDRSMLIWLGKQYLGQAEKVEQTMDATLDISVDYGDAS